MRGDFAAALEEVTNEDGWEHVADIMFDPQDSPDERCLLCVAGERAGAWENFTGQHLSEIVAEMGDD